VAFLPLNGWMHVAERAIYPLGRRGWVFSEDKIEERPRPNHWPAHAYFIFPLSHAAGPGQALPRPQTLYTSSGGAGEDLLTMWSTHIIICSHFLINIFFFKCCFMVFPFTIFVHVHYVFFLFIVYTVKFFCVIFLLISFFSYCKMKVLLVLCFCEQKKLLEKASQ
jgi:hypothetical protein